MPFIKNVTNHLPASPTHHYLTYPTHLGIDAPTYSIVPAEGGAHRMHPFGLCLPSISHESSYLLSLQLALTVFAQPPSQHWFLQNQTTSPHALLALRETLLCLLSLFLQLWDLRTALGNTALIQRLYGGGT